MSIQDKNNYFNPLQNETIVVLLESFLPKNDFMKLGLTCAVVKDTLSRKLTQEQVHIKRDLNSLFEIKLIDPENETNLNSELLLATLKSTSEKVDAKMKEFLINIKILYSLNPQGLSNSEMIEINSMNNRYFQHKELEKTANKLIHHCIQMRDQQRINMVRNING